jgi:hypothetical protein
VVSKTEIFKYKTPIISADNAIVTWNSCRWHSLAKYIEFYVTNYCFSLWNHLSDTLICYFNILHLAPSPSSLQLIFRTVSPLLDRLPIMSWIPKPYYISAQHILTTHSLLPDHRNLTKKGITRWFHKLRKNLYKNSIYFALLWSSFLHSW